MQNFEPSRYERPTQKWVCGWASEGRSCPVGPTRRGRCIATYECCPIQRNGRWFCTRSNSNGGRCDEGPSPDGKCCHEIPKCQPVLSQRAKRGDLSKRLLWYAFGILLFFILGPEAPSIITPGNLAAPHKPLNRKCEVCHSTSEREVSAWLLAAWNDKEHSDDSQKCLKCHVLGKNGQMAHGMVPDRLSEITRKKEKTENQKQLVHRVASSLHLKGWPSPESPLSCASCHREHRGDEYSLKSVGNQKCQICHITVFQTFEDDHPDFAGYPYVRRTRLIFDHNSHMNKHFSESEEVAEHAPNTCRSCHALDPSGRFMNISNFEIACAACHEPQILGKGKAGYKGIPFIAVPGLDVEYLKRSKINIGYWPKDSEVEEIPPFIYLLLMGNSGNPNFKSKIKNLDLLDLSGAEKNQLKVVGELAWAIKKLLYELATDGQQGLRRRLERAMGRVLAEAELSELAAQFPVDLVRAAQEDWFPGLASEIERMEEGRRKSPQKKKSRKKEKNKDKKEGAEEKTTAESASIVGGWYRQDFVLFYRPSGHKDRFLKGWLDLTGEDHVVPSDKERPLIFSVLSDRETPGKCAKCHSIDDMGNGKRVVNWMPKQNVMDLKAFTRFSHGSHFSLLDEEGCLTCHKFAKDSNYATGYKDFDPQTFVSNFVGMPKKLCAECHRERQASNNCLTCHNYHIGRIKPAVKDPPLQEIQVSEKISR